MARLINPYNGIIFFEKDKRSQLAIALKKLIDSFNRLSETETIQRIFHLQKINFILNQMPFDMTLFNWVNTDSKTEGSWEHALKSYGINSYASFFLKTAQFAYAVIKEAPELSIHEGDDLYKLMQERDALLAKAPVSSEEDTANYIEVCCRINHLMQSQKQFTEIIARHEEILKLARDKITNVIGHTRKDNPAYKVKRLGAAETNNVNILFEMAGWKEPLVFRIEDRAKLDIEQSLHSHPVATRYFGDDAGIFIIQTKKEESSNADKDTQSAEDTPSDNVELEFSPVALSQFANQGNLQSVAHELRDKNSKLDKILTDVKYYFTQLNDFCMMLENADKTYHPDIKLSNFLVHNNKLLVCDRKTFVRGSRQCATDIRASKYQAPREYRACINKTWTGFLPNADSTFFDMPQFMAYQVGIALKEFLGLSQTEELPKGFYNPAYDIRTLFTGKLSRQIVNYALIIQAMTAEKEGCRLSIPQFQQLIPYVNHPTDVFKSKLGEILANSVHLNSLNTVLGNKKLRGAKLLEQTAIALESLNDNIPKMSQVKSVAEELATKCTKDYLARHAQAISKAMATKDWNAAPWYRRWAYYLSFSLYDVEHVTLVKDVSIELNMEEYENQMYILDFLPESHNLFDTPQSTLVQNYIQLNLEQIKAGNTETLEPGAPTVADQEAPPVDKTIENTVARTVVRTFKEIEQEAMDNGTFVARPDSNLRNGPQVDVEEQEEDLAEPGEKPQSGADKASNAAPSFFNRFAQRNQPLGPQHRTLHRKGTIFMSAKERQATRLASVSEEPRSSAPQ